MHTVQKSAIRSPNTPGSTLLPLPTLFLFLQILASLVITLQPILLDQHFRLSIHLTTSSAKAPMSFTNSRAYLEAMRLFIRIFKFLAVNIQSHLRSKSGCTKCSFLAAPSSSSSSADVLAHLVTNEYPDIPLPLPKQRRDALELEPTAESDAPGGGFISGLEGKKRRPRRRRGVRRKRKETRVGQGASNLSDCKSGRVGTVLDSSLVLSSSSSSMDGCGTRRHDKNRGKFKKEGPKSCHMSYTNSSIEWINRKKDW